MAAYIFGTIDKTNKKIEALGHRWDIAIDNGIVPQETLHIPDLRADLLLTTENFNDCMRCEEFKAHYPLMLFSGIYNPDESHART